MTPQGAKAQNVEISPAGLLCHYQTAHFELGLSFGVM